MASDMIVTDYACTLRLLPEERQVLSYRQNDKQNSYLRDFTSHPLDGKRSVKA